MTEPTPQPSPSTPNVPTKEQLKAALKAFKKKLKLTRLDHESRLGRNPATTGKSSSIVAITLPYGHPPEVWEELVRQGKLKREREGTYELAGE
jgi:hypothetical protein